MRFCSIASGSSGNCIYVGSGSTNILIDTGISAKRIEVGLNSIGLKTGEISAILVTHEHSDHISSVGVLARRYGIPIYATDGTIKGILNTKSVGEIDNSLFNTVSTDTKFSIRDMIINPFRISHDANEPCAYRIKCDDGQISIATDLGYYDEYIVDNMRGSDVVLCEANHDVRMLQVGPYPYHLKQRILSNHGHLSNENCGRMISEFLHDNIKHIFLGHLSHENNLPELAYETVRLEIEASDTKYHANDFPISVARRDIISQLIEV